MPDKYTAIGDPQLEMSCVRCRGVFHGTKRNVLGTQEVEGQVLKVAICDNCLKEAGLG